MARGFDAPHFGGEGRLAQAVLFQELLLRVAGGLVVGGPGRRGPRSELRPPLSPQVRGQVVQHVLAVIPPLVELLPARCRVHLQLPVEGALHGRGERSSSRRPALVRSQGRGPPRSRKQPPLREVLGGGCARGEAPGGGGGLCPLTRKNGGRGSGGADGDLQRLGLGPRPAQGHPPERGPRGQRRGR